MVYIWDYFMRRKALLLALIGVFALSSILSYQALTSNSSETEPVYVSINSWTEQVDIPLTGGQKMTIAVMQADEVVSLPEIMQRGDIADVPNVNVGNEDITDSEWHDDTNMDVRPEESGGNEHELPINDNSTVVDVPSGGDTLLSSDIKLQDEQVELAIPEPQEKNRDMSDAISLTLAIVVVLAAGGYFVYQHFMR